MNSPWVDLFVAGKWKECSQALDLDLKTAMLKEGGSDRHLKRILLENNRFVSDQLSRDWEYLPEENISCDWAKSYKNISELFRVMRAQHACTGIPLELVLCVTCNAMWWALMKVDPLDQHSCRKDVLSMAVYSLKTAAKSCGVWDFKGRSSDSIEADFLQSARTSISCLFKLTPINCQQTFEIILLGLLCLLDEEKLWGKPPDFQQVMDQLADVLPQIEVHCSFPMKKDQSNVSNYELFKFGWHEICEFLSKTNISVLSEIFLMIVTVNQLRGSAEDLMEKSRKALVYLNSIDSKNLSFPLLFHYMNALAYLNTGNLETSLYHLVQTSMLSSNFFKEGRCNTLRGRVLLKKDKPLAALEILQSVKYKDRYVQIPYCAFLIGEAFQQLGRFGQQAEVLDLLSECLLAEPPVQPKLLNPLAGIEHRLFLSVHIQPEVSCEEVLRFSAMAYLSNKQPKKASEKLLQLLQIASVNKDDFGDNSWQFSELIHDTVSVLLDAYSISIAEELCEAALRFHSSSGQLTTPNINSLKEDVIALLLLAHAKTLQGSPDVFEILNRCGKLLQNFVNKFSKLEEDHKDTIKLSKALLARIYLGKALLNVERGFQDDAIACFKRALLWKEDDREVVLQFADYLMKNNLLNHYRSMDLLGIYRKAKSSSMKTDSIALNFLLREKMDKDKKEIVICRLESQSPTK